MYLNILFFVTIFLTLILVYLFHKYWLYLSKIWQQNKLLTIIDAYKFLLFLSNTNNSDQYEKRIKLLRFALIVLYLSIIILKVVPSNFVAHISKI